jgi:hypothetical protein
VDFIFEEEEKSARMHIEILVEESTAEAALRNILPRILNPSDSFGIHPFQGKPDLLGKLPQRLRGYQTWLPSNWCIVVLIDADDDDCRELKDRLEQIAARSGLVTKPTRRGEEPFQVLSRLAIEELEAWFFGDAEALHAAYPRIPPSLGQKARFRDPDAVKGGTWEALERELKRRGYHPEGSPKITVAREVSRHMVPERNRSKSFQVFCRGLAEIVSLSG